jgi:hypothetical protein
MAAPTLPPRFAPKYQTDVPPAITTPNRIGPTTPSQETLAGTSVVGGRHGPTLDFHNPCGRKSRSQYCHFAKADKGYL